MTSATSSSARMLFDESKHKLADRVLANINNVASLTRQIQRGSKSNEMLSKSARDFAYQETSIDNSEGNLKKMQLISLHMGYQYENIQKTAAKLENINEQAASMQR